MQLLRCHTSSQLLPRKPHTLISRQRLTPGSTTTTKLNHRHHRLRLGRSSQKQTTVVAQAASEDTYYPGTYGAWKVEQEDVVEVWTYRVGLSVAATAFAVGTLAGVGNDASWAQPIQNNGNIIAAIGAAGLGISLYQIHIYVTELKRLLQAFWLLGTLGGIYTIVSNFDTPLPTYVSSHPSAVWLIGPFFAALTGLTFKEGVCYGKAEAGLLTLLVPSLLIGHLSGLLHGDGFEKGFVVIVAVLLLIFAGRKYTQPIAADIGDKSVFEFRKLSEEEQRVRIQQLRAAGGGGGLFDDDVEMIIEGDVEDANENGV